MYGITEAWHSTSPSDHGLEVKTPIYENEFPDRLFRGKRILDFFRQSSNLFRNPKVTASERTSCSPDVQLFAKMEPGS